MYRIDRSQKVQAKVQTVSILILIYKTYIFFSGTEILRRQRQQEKHCTKRWRLYEDRHLRPARVTNTKRPQIKYIISPTAVLHVKTKY